MITLNSLRKRKGKMNKYLDKYLDKIYLICFLLFIGIFFGYAWCWIALN